MKKILFILVFLVLLSPLVEIFVESLTPKLGDENFDDIDGKNFFLHSSRTECYDFFKKDGEMPLDCYFNHFDYFLDIDELSNRPTGTSLGYNFERIKYLYLSTLYSKAVNPILWSGRANLRAPEGYFCYLDEEILAKGFNISNDRSMLEFSLTDDFNFYSLKSFPRGVATNFFSHDYFKYHLRNRVFNYNLKKEYDEDFIHSQFMYFNLLSSLIVGDANINYHNLVMFEDNCSFYRFYDFLSPASSYDESKIFRTGLTAKEIREDYAEMFRVYFQRMEFFEEIIDKGIKEDIFYLSYYPEYEKIWVVVKIPEEKIKDAKVLIDGDYYNYTLTYPFLFVDVPKLEDGKHNLEIIGEESYSIEFHVDTTNIFVFRHSFNTEEDEIIMQLMNLYDKDVVIEKIEFEGEDIYCEMDLDLVVPYNVSIIEGKYNYPVINYTEVKIPCDFSKYLDERVKVDKRIHWRFLNDTTKNVINGMWFTRVN